MLVDEKPGSLFVLPSSSPSPKLRFLLALAVAALGNLVAASTAASKSSASEC